MVSICFEQKYYTLCSCGPADDSVTGELVAGAIREHPDPAEWRRLIKEAIFIPCDAEEVPCPPTDEVIEAFRQRAESHFHRVMTRHILNTIENPSEASKFIAKMKSLFNDPAWFLNFYRETDWNEQFPGQKLNGWELISNVVLIPDCNMFFLCLKLGFFLFSNGPFSEPPEFVYLINLDSEACCFSSRRARGRRIFEMKCFPENWRQILLIPRCWLELAYAYGTQGVREKVLLMLHSDLKWRLVVENTAAQAWRSFDDCLSVLNLVLRFLSGGVVDKELYNTIAERLQLPPLQREDDGGPEDEQEDGDEEEQEVPRVRGFQEELHHKGVLALKLALQPVLEVALETPHFFY